MEDVAQEQPVSEQVQDQQAEQAVEQAATALGHRLDEVLSGEHALVVLLVRLAVKAGLYAGIGLMQPGNTRFAAIDLPSGQVSWAIEDSEATWFDGVPLYDKLVVLVSNGEQTRRLLAAL